MSTVTLSDYQGTDIEKSFSEYHDDLLKGFRQGLVKKRITDKTGKVTTVWVRPEGDVKTNKKKTLTEHKKEIIPGEHSVWVMGKYEDSISVIEEEAKSAEGEFGNGDSQDGYTFHFPDEKSKNKFIKEVKKYKGSKVRDISE